MDATLVNERMVSGLCAWFGGFALLIASIGLYGRLSYAVSERTGELGVRMALGARHGQVVWMVLRDALILTVVGIAIGVPLALASTKIFRSLLFAVSVADASTFVVIVAGITGVTSIAGYIPARRAASVDPVIALRAEQRLGPAHRSVNVHPEFYPRLSRRRRPTGDLRIVNGPRPVELVNHPPLGC